MYAEYTQLQLTFLALHPCPGDSYQRYPGDSYQRSWRQLSEISWRQILETLETAIRDILETDIRDHGDRRYPEVSIVVLWISGSSDLFHSSSIFCDSIPYRKPFNWVKHWSSSSKEPTLDIEIKLFKFTIINTQVLIFGHSKQKTYTDSSQRCFLTNHLIKSTIFLFHKSFVNIVFH